MSASALTTRRVDSITAPMSVPPAPLPPKLSCKICGGDSARFSAVDFAKCCSPTPWDGRDPVGVPVMFYRCTGCGLIFTNFFDAWSPAEFKTHVYNDGYLAVDGDYVETRPRQTAELIAGMFARRDLRVLDYGGGSGATAGFLGQRGFADVTVYEPFDSRFTDRPAGPFDLIVCVEVIEHSIDPNALARDLASFLGDPGLIVLTTLVQDPSVETAKGEHWYLAPRNGHTHFHSTPSLQTCFGQTGLGVAHANQNLHIVAKTVPDWARHLFEGAPAQPV